MPLAVHPQKTAKVLLLCQTAESLSSVSGPFLSKQLSIFRCRSTRLLCNHKSFSGSPVSKEIVRRGVSCTHSGSFHSGANRGRISQPSEFRQQYFSPLHRRGSMSASVSLLSAGLPCGTSISLKSSESPNPILLGGYNHGPNSIKCHSRDNRKWTDRCLFGSESIHRCSLLGATARTLVALKQSKVSGINNLRSLCVSARSAGSVPDVSYNGLPQEDQEDSSTISSGQNVDQRTIKLQSGSCYLPHPAKEASGGEDAHFVCADEQVIGVADGVGGWAEVGINAGLYSRELMAHSVAFIKEEPKGYVNPSRVLEKAYALTKAAGSSTACIIALTDKGIHAVNLGDSGFIVVRDGSTIFSSPVQQHDFNFTYQLGSSAGGDLPSSAQVFTFSVAPGDVIVAGSDGLFDNLFNNEIAAVVAESVAEGLDPEGTAKAIATLARERALNKNRQTPFAAAAQAAGYHFFGGKLDDLTVVVSYVTPR